MSNPRPLLILLALLVLWQGLVWITGVPAFLLPPPTTVAGRLVSARTPTSTITRLTTIASTGCFTNKSVNARFDSCGP